MRTFLAALLAVTAMGCASADAQQQAQTPPPPPCQSAEFHQMDFWIGDWDGYYTADRAQPAGARNIITREYGGCVIQEQFDGGPASQNLIGHSVSMYYAPSQQWRQTWVDNQGGYYALNGGPVGDKFILHLVPATAHPPANAPQMRMVFEDITRGSFTWRWQRSTDAGQTWTDAWTIWYVRRA